mmetsp:Transcript_6657/g.13518  ORF Transcript_6657/g.13518 Transcript_6657/m.13518 type:complete len:136 (+) Transcript_6657:2134-2541(+)
MLKKLSLQLLVYIARWSPDGMELLTSSHASVLPRLILLLDEEICKIRRIVAPIIFEGDLYNLPQEAGSTDACHPPETSSSVILISEAVSRIIPVTHPKNLRLLISLARSHTTTPTHPPTLCRQPRVAVRTPSAIL